MNNQGAFLSKRNYSLANRKIHDSKLANAGPKAKWMYEVKPEKEVNSRVLIGDSNCRAKIRGDSSSRVLLSLRLESFDSNKSYCSDEGAKSEASIAANDTDDSSVDDAASLKLSDVFDNYEMTSDDESINMKPSLRKVRFQDSYGNSTT